MKRLVMLACAAALVTMTSCGGDPVASATPSPSAVPNVPSGVIAPVDKARDTVDQLNQLQNRTEQQTGGGAGYTP